MGAMSAMGVQDPASPEVDVPVSSSVQRNMGWFSPPSYAWGKEEEENEDKEKRKDVSALLTQALSFSPHQQIRKIRGLPSVDTHSCTAGRSSVHGSVPKTAAGGHTWQDGRACCRGESPLDGSSQCQAVEMREATGENKRKTSPHDLRLKTFNRGHVKWL